MFTIIYAIKRESLWTSREHANLGRTIGCSIAQQLQKPRTEIKVRVKNVENGTGTKQRALGENDRRPRDQHRCLQGYVQERYQYPVISSALVDSIQPALARSYVANVVACQDHEENALQKLNVIMQQDSTPLRGGHGLRCPVRDQWQSRMSLSVHLVSPRETNGLACA
ncbi:hypothetical protein HYDPIDRAFT_32291 [Hydnomerulius pinastri MD-312]|uniref:SLM1/RGC1-like BAR-like domain-containing protein n=1 Tax=Hydnomerulius pinastri MD-312 TaxID=994086 RepID=A0A0C9WA75_9AGAM|nr:hypothetical protein HYDPIDRAFT_32291 [Hydnomerulius pinastri MD-312]